MALYFVEYDLRKQKDYTKLILELERLGASKILASAWYLKHNNTSCTELRDHLRSFMDNDDGLMISQVENWASYNVLSTPR